MKARVDVRSPKRARPVSVRVKTGVRAGGIILGNHNETLLSPKRACPVSLRIKTGVRAGGTDGIQTNHNAGFISPNHNETLVMAGGRT
jgi:hypothetical protein